MDKIERFLAIPAFSDASCQVARQRANDCHNHGVFAHLVVPRQYDSVDDFVEKARIADPQLLERAPCQGIVFDPVVSKNDFFDNTFMLIQLMIQAVNIPSFLVRYSHVSQYTTILARDTSELKVLKEKYWEKHGMCQSMIQVICPTWVIDEGLAKQLNRDSHVVALGNTDEPFEASWAGVIFQKFSNVIVVF